MPDDDDPLLEAGDEEEEDDDTASPTQWRRPGCPDEERVHRG